MNWRKQSWLWMGNPANLASAFGYPDGAVQLWRLPEGTPLVKINVPAGMNEFTQIALSPGGEILATVAENTVEAMGKGIVQLWRVSDGKLLNRLDAIGVIQAVFWFHLYP